MNIEITAGSAIDLISILRLKKAFSGKDVDAQMANILNEIGDMEQEPLSKQLAAINLGLWLLESAVRKDDEFFEIYARGIFGLNEVRAEVKRQIDLKHHQSSSEGKVYEHSGA